MEHRKNATFSAGVLTTSESDGICGATGYRNVHTHHISKNFAILGKSS